MPRSHVLEFPGLIDLTYFVDFRFLDYVVRSNELQSWLLPQGQFLRALGLETRAQILRASCKDEQTRRLLDEQIHRISAPEAMGSVYKFLFFAREGVYPFGPDCLTQRC